MRSTSGKTAFTGRWIEDPTVAVRRLARYQGDLDDDCAHLRARLLGGPGSSEATERELSIEVLHDQFGEEISDTVSGGLLVSSGEIDGFRGPASKR